ncbi:MAG: pitrilysin family protein [Oscillospiraceae bacterium]
MQTYKMCEGVDLHTIEAPKFKTNIISLFFNIPLKRDTVTSAALIPSVMKRGTKEHETFTDIVKYLEDMYSASFGAGVRFKGDGEVLGFSIEYIRDKFIGENLTTKIIEFLKSFIFKPLVIDGGFKAEYVDGEKENLKNAILSLINDKKEYAEVKCREIMFGKEGYGMYEAGYVEDLSKINPENLYEFYQNVINEAHVDIFASGNFEGEDIVQTLKDAFGGCLNPRHTPHIKTQIAVSDKTDVVRVVEEIDVVQSKLCMGFLCNTNPANDEYYALMLASCIFGGSPFSKLFNNVREKLSLAYYAVARTERFKSVMTISSGIETEKYQAAYDEIMVQFEKMKSGDFDDGEINAGKKYLATGLNSMKDSLRTMEDYYLSQTIMGYSQDIDELLNCISNVNADDIKKAFQKIKLSTVFFLKGNSKGENE